MNSEVQVPHHRRSLFSLMPFLAVLLVVGACGGSSDSDTDTSSSAEAPSVEPDPTEEAESVADGSGTATLTIADGTVYELILTSCDTQDTDPSGFPLTNGFGVFGHTADDDVEFSVTRAGLDDDDPYVSGNLEGGIQSDQRDSKMIYFAVTDSVDITATGNQVAGALDFRSAGPAKTHGDVASATLEATC